MIEITNVTKRYGEKTVIDNLTLSLPTDRFTVVMGASGSGKTTLLRLIAGLERQDAGNIDGVPSVAMVFQEPRLFAHLDALANVALVSDMPTAERTLRALELDDALHKRPSELSGGMCQRVALARALAAGREYLLLDEPFRGLDAGLRERVMEYVRTTARAGLLVTHDPDEARYFSQTVISLPQL